MRKLTEKFIKNVIHTRANYRTDAESSYRHGRRHRRYGSA